MSQTAELDFPQTTTGGNSSDDDDAPLRRTCFTRWQRQPLGIKWRHCQSPHVYGSSCTNYNIL